MEVPSAGSPSEQEMLEYLRRRQEYYCVDYARASVALGKISLLAMAGPTAVGKSTLSRAVTAANPDIHEYISSTTRPRDKRDGNDYITADEGMTVEKFYEGVKEGVVVNYFVHKNGAVYGTFFDGFKAPYTIGAIGTETIEQLQSAGFRDVHTVYTLTDHDTYEKRLTGSRILQRDILPRLQEGLISLRFARQNATENWMSFIKLDNEPGKLEESADTIARIARHHSVPTLSLAQAYPLIDGMETIIRRTIQRINVQ